ncbi:tetratricopeptide repeat protein [uncultured Actinomyces sp.]|uniref:tetratricopeptide repeat protein n=1 Tax=uncultured Actinomyces sp. TaxID=249061 RepID=UPI00260C21D0|nr:tetratricopeptide repeat protein [uncultured Actinomyces sp.]
MPDPVVVAVAKVGIALTKVLLRACDSSFGADLVGDGQKLVGDLSRALRRTDKSKGQIEHRVSQALVTSTDAMRERCSSQGVNPDLLSGVCTEVEIILEEVADNGALLLSAVRTPESFPETLREYADRRRMNVEAAAEPYFDELVGAVATEYSALAPWSTRFQIEAFKSILSGIDEIQENSRLSLDAHAVTHDKLDTLSSKLAEVAHHENKPSRVFFGSRPDVATGDRFIARREQQQVNSLIADPTQRRTVLVGMRGCGKTQLAAALAKQCEDANWSLIAWVNAVSPESIKSALVELAKELKIDTSDEPPQEQIIARCLNSLRSSEASDRLVIFDNVEDINDLRGLVPTGDGLRVVATTTNNTGWEYQDWTTIKVGGFDHNESIDYLLTVTKSDDHDTADVLAERLGDLPLAIAQAAATARHKNLSLSQYLNQLDTYRSERAIRPVPGDYYADDVATALCMAIEDALENLADPTRRYARRQLGALALLAESGVPTRWLDPTIEQQDDRELQGTNSAEDEDAHDALTELIHRSIIQQSADKATTMLHRLQAQAFRESWAENEAAEAYESAAILLGKVDVDSFPRNETDARRRETLDLIEQLRAVGEQKYSRCLFEKAIIASSLFEAFSHAHDQGLFSEALTLEGGVVMIQELLGPEHPKALAASHNLAHAYEAAGHVPDAIRMYEQVLADQTRIFGACDPRTFTTSNNLAGAYESGGYFNEAISLYTQVLENRLCALGPDHPDVLTTRNDLAHAYASAGQFSEAISMFQLVLKDRLRILGPDHPDTIHSRNNLAYAYASAGYLLKGLDLYLQVFTEYARTLGPYHRYTLASRKNIADLYASAGLLNAAVPLYEDVLSDYQRILGLEHPLTKTVRENFEAAKRELEQQEEDSAAE